MTTTLECRAFLLRLIVRLILSLHTDGVKHEENASCFSQRPEPAPVLPAHRAGPRKPQRRRCHFCVRNCLCSFGGESSQTAINRNLVYPRLYRQNLNSLSLASRPLHPPWKYRLGKQHPGESTGWLAGNHPLAASAEVYGLNSRTEAEKASPVSRQPVQGDRISLE